MNAPRNPFKEIGRMYKADTAHIPRPRHGWWNDMACDPDDDDDMWFPKGVNGSQTEWRLMQAYADAFAICSACPVRVDCGNAALIEEGPASVLYRFGMRGGMRPDQRAAKWARLSAQLEEAS